MSASRAGQPLRGRHHGRGAVRMKHEAPYSSTRCVECFLPVSGCPECGESEIRRAACQWHCSMLLVPDYLYYGRCADGACLNAPKTFPPSLSLLHGGRASQALSRYLRTFAFRRKLQSKSLGRKLVLSPPSRQGSSSKPSESSFQSVIQKIGIRFIAEICLREALDLFFEHMRIQ